MKNKIIILFILLECACGCVSLHEKGPRFTGIQENKSGYSLLYIYRPHEYIGQSVWPKIFIGNTKVVDLFDQSYTFVYIKPGSYRIHTEKSLSVSQIPNTDMRLDFDPGSVYFMCFNQKYEKYGSLLPSYNLMYGGLVLTKEKEAISELNRLRYVKPYMDFIWQ